MSVAQKAAQTILLLFIMGLDKQAIAYRRPFGTPRRADYNHCKPPDAPFNSVVVHACHRFIGVDKAKSMSGLSSVSSQVALPSAVKSFTTSWKSRTWSARPIAPS